MLLLKICFYVLQYLIYLSLILKLTFFCYHLVWVDKKHTHLDGNPSLPCLITAFCELYGLQVAGSESQVLFEGFKQLTNNLILRVDL